MNLYLKSLWLTETVRLVEQEKGRFNDSEANRQARSVQGDLSQRIIKRAEIISQEYGFVAAQKECLQACRFATLILLLIAVLSGAGLAFSALAQHPVNLYWALLCLLGFHLFTLFLWLFSCYFFPNDSGGLLAQVWFFLAKKLPQKMVEKEMIPSFTSLFGSKIRWFIGVITHLLWSVALFSALVVLVVLLSTNYYSFEWKTTLLSSDFMVNLTHLLSSIPSMLGFPLPDADVIRSSEKAINGSEVRSIWASWLLGVFIVYGLGVRLLLLIICWLKWRVVCRNVTLNLHRAEYQLLSHDITPQPMKTIIDKEGRTSQFHKSHLSHSVLSSTKSKQLVAIDIEKSWHPPDDIDFLGFLNDRDERTTYLDFLQRNPAQKLLIAVDTDRSPDRGMLNLIQLLLDKSTQCKLWFINQGRQYNVWLEISTKLNIDVADVSWLHD